MTVFLIIILFAAGFLQYKMGRTALKKVRCSLRCEQHLVEPGEAAKLVFTLDNRSRFPILFLRCSCATPVEAELRESKKGTLIPGIFTSKYTFQCFLMPKQHLEHRFELAFPRRGRYPVDSITVAAGDFFGLKERERSFTGGATVVVMPEKLRESVSDQVLGGLMGERSVRRWIHEDPILSAGFREYTGREPQKTISWPRSLQSGKLMVRQMDHTAEPRVTVLFSVWEGHYDNLEPCFSLCRTVCERLEQRRLPFAFLHNGTLATSVGGLPPVEAGLGKQHLARILEGLGRATYDSTGNLSSLISRALARNQSSSSYILVVAALTPEVRVYARRLESETGSAVHIASSDSLLRRRPGEVTA